MLRRQQLLQPIIGRIPRLWGISSAFRLPSAASSHASSSIRLLCSSSSSSQLLFRRQSRGVVTKMPPTAMGNTPQKSLSQNYCWNIATAMSRSPFQPDGIPTLPYLRQTYHYQPLYHHHHHQQRRPYVFLPTSWTELKLRLRKVTEARTIKVKLWRDETSRRATRQYEKAKVRLKKAQSYARTQNAKYLKRVQDLYLKYTGIRQNTTATSIYDVYRDGARKLSRRVRERGLEWFQRRLPRRWRSMVSAPHPRHHHRYHHQYRALVRRTQHLQLQFWKRQRKLVKVMKHAQKRIRHAATQHTSRVLGKTKTVPVRLHEYSESSWFDAAGRPVVSRDETGRFVNPWMSESTNGVHSLETLVRWRWGRLKREWEQYGVGLFLPSFLTSQNAQVTSTKKTGAAQSSGLAGVPDAVPIPKPLTDPNILRCTLIGHSTCWIQKGNWNLLTDPIFSDRASPWQNTPIGCARDLAPACSIAELPDRIDVCLLSHDHYDHLDKPSVRNLRDRVQMWVCPLGMKAWLEEKADIPPHKIVEMGWWDSVLLRQHRSSQHNSLVVAERRSLQKDSKNNQPHPSFHKPATAEQIWLTAFPAQHWSSRTFFDRNYRLWVSYGAFFDQDQTFFFAGDTGFPEQFPLFEQVTQYVGRPIDLAALPIGAYDPRFLNSDAHLDPFEAVKLHKILQCRNSIAIHHMSFPLGEEPHDEPARLLRQAAAEANVRTFKVVPNGGSVSVQAGVTSS